MTLKRDIPLILIGGGGHAKVVFDTLTAQDFTFLYYVDPKASLWLEAAGVKRLTEEQLAAMLPDAPQLIMGYAGLTCDILKRRLHQIKEYRAKGAVFPAVIHPSAAVSARATLAPGVQLLAGAVVNSHATIGEGAIINSGAIVEHDAVISAGTHLAPRAVALGNTQIGESAFIGSGSVVVQSAFVPNNTFIKALTVYK